jgi:hypothetical protein
MGLLQMAQKCSSCTIGCLEVEHLLEDRKVVSPPPPVWLCLAELSELENDSGRELFPVTANPAPCCISIDIGNTNLELTGTVRVIFCPSSTIEFALVALLHNSCYLFAAAMQTERY